MHLNYLNSNQYWSTIILVFGIIELLFSQQPHWSTRYTSIWLFLISNNLNHISPLVTLLYLFYYNIFIHFKLNYEIILVLRGGYDSLSYNYSTLRIKLWNSIIWTKYNAYWLIRYYLSIFNCSQRQKKLKEIKENIIFQTEWTPKEWN